MKLSEQSKRWLAQALLELMQQKDFHTITVKDIADKAGVSRLTFYRHFETKEDILRFHLNMDFQEYMEQLRNMPDIDLSQAIALCYRVWDRRRGDIRMLSRQKLNWLLREPFGDCMHLVLRQMGLDQQYSEFQIDFLTGGMFAGMLSWIDDPQGRTPEEIAEEILEILVSPPNQSSI